MCTQTLAAASAANPLLQAHNPGLPASQAASAPQQAQQQQQQPPALFMPKAHHHPMKQRLHDFARSQMRNEDTGTSGDPPDGSPAQSAVATGASATGVPLASSWGQQ